MSYSPTYATIVQLRDYTGKTSGELSDTAALAVLQRAEADIDSLAVVGRPVDDTTGLRFDPDTLTAAEVRTLARATCAQAEYRLEMGASFFIRPQHAEVSGPEFTTKGRLGRIGPQTYNELRGSQLVRLTTTTTNSRGELDPWRRV